MAKAEEERRAHKLQEAEQLRKELETNPALLEKMELEARRKVEARQDYAFHQMEDMELHRIFGMGSIFRQTAAHRVSWAWRKQALSELQQLRETERSSREELAQDPDAALAAKEKLIRQLTSTATQATQNISPGSYPSPYRWMSLGSTQMSRPPFIRSLAINLVFRLATREAIIAVMVCHGSGKWQEQERY